MTELENAKALAPEGTTHYVELIPQHAHEFYKLTLGGWFVYRMNRWVKTCFSPYLSYHSYHVKRFLR